MVMAQQDVEYFVERDGFDDVAHGESVWLGISLRGRSERHDSVFVFQADDNTYEIGEVLALHTAELHMFQ